jgi:predicted GIY-YIG superfamily endonuclease
LLGDVWKDLANNEEAEKKKKKRKDNRSVFFVMGFSNVCRFLRIPKLMKKLKKRYKLSWLCVNMAYQQFTNLRERFSGDLTGKLNAGLKPLDLMSRPCNCNSRSKVNGQCVFNEQCRAKVLVYKVTCLCCNLVYIGVTQRTLKRRVQEHISAVNSTPTTDKKGNHVEKSRLSICLAQRNHWPEIDATEKPSPALICSKLRIKIVYRANPIGAIRTFGTPSCKICMKERMEIFNSSFNQLVKLMNSRTKIHGPCKHHPDFHRFSTDESHKEEKVEQSSLTNHE